MCGVPEDRGGASVGYNNKEHGGAAQLEKAILIMNS